MCASLGPGGTRMLSPRSPTPSPVLCPSSRLPALEQGKQSSTLRAGKGHSLHSRCCPGPQPGLGEGGQGPAQVLGETRLCH